jgi:hypothetical protein
LSVVSGFSRTRAGEADAKGEDEESFLDHRRVTCAETQTHVPFRFCQSSV